MSARHVALGLGYGLWIGMFCRDLIEHFDALAHKAPAKVRRAVELAAARVEAEQQR